MVSVAEVLYGLLEIGPIENRRTKYEAYVSEMEK